MKSNDAPIEQSLPQESKGETSHITGAIGASCRGITPRTRTAADDLLSSSSSPDEEDGSHAAKLVDGGGAELVVVNNAADAGFPGDKHRPPSPPSKPVLSGRGKNGAGATRPGRDDGPNPAELVRAIEGQIGHHLCHRDQWYKYVKGVFVLVDPHEYLPIALGLLPEDKRLRRVADELLRTYEGLRQVPGSNLRGLYSMADNQRTVLLNCANGVLVVTPDTVRFDPHSPDHHFTAKLCAAWNPEASEERMTAAVMKFLPDPEDQAAFDWWSGYVVLPDIRVRHALANIGETHTGKTTLWEFGIASVFPKQALRSGSLAEICNPNGYFVATLPGSALNLGGELAQTELLSSDKFKILVGGEDVPARAIRGDPFTLSGYTTKFIFLGNHLPRFSRGSDAEASRLRYLFYDQVSENPDKSLQQRLKGERDGVFSRRMVPALQRILAGAPCPPGGAKSKALHERFAVVNDPFKAFMNEWCCLDPNRSVDKDDLALAYGQFSAQHDLPSCHKDTLMKVLRERYPQLAPGRETANGERNRVVKGLRFKKPLERLAKREY